MSDPLDVARFVTSPCEALTKAQLDDFGGAEPRPRTMDSGKQECSWDFGTNGRTNIGLWFQPGPTGSGLSDVYAQNEQGNWDQGYFEPTEIEGYPAVFVAINEHRDRGDCELSVGVRDELYAQVVVLATSKVGRASCEAASNAASAMIKTMAGAGSGGDGRAADLRELRQVAWPGWAGRCAGSAAAVGRALPAAVGSGEAAGGGVGGALDRRGVGAARRAAGPLAVESVKASEQFTTGQDLLRRQVDSYEHAKRNVVPVPPMPRRRSRGVTWMRS